MPIKKIVEAVETEEGGEWVLPLGTDTILNVGFRMGKPMDEEMGGAIAIGDELY